MKDKKISSDTFCAAPWFMVRNTNLGQYKLCCIADTESTDFHGKTDYNLEDTDIESWTNSEYMRYVRTNLSSGVKIADCNKCWKREENSQESLRQKYNQEILLNSDVNKSWTINYFRTHNIDEFGFIVGADVKTNNLCNLACAMCSPKDSSIIANEWNQTIDSSYVQHQLKDNPTYIEEIKRFYKLKSNYHLLGSILAEPNLKFLKILGGEPLLDKKIQSLLDKCDNKKSINLMIVTNGTINLKNFVESNYDYKFIYFTVSLEGYGLYNDYIRKKSDWKNIASNILNAKELNKTQISIHSTVQALSLSSLPELIKWCKHNDIIWEFDMCDNPKYHSVNALPENYFYNQIKKIKDVDNDVAEYLVSQYEDNSEIYKLQFIEYLEWYNNGNFEIFKDLFPELYAFLFDSDL